MAKERNQNPVVGDDLTLRLITYNSNNYADPSEIVKVDIFFLQPSDDEDCVDKCKKVLVQTIDGSSVVKDDTGNYSITINLPTPQYVTGTYIDEWNVIYRAGDAVTLVDNRFTIYPSLWYTTTIPAVYGFSFNFQPNRIRQGSIKWLIVQIVPNVPRATDLERYYTNLAISANLQIFIEQNCGPCVPPEQDLRLVVDGDTITVRDKVFGFYKLDTTDLDCGVYDIWFQLDYAGAVEVSPKMQLQIF